MGNLSSCKTTLSKKAPWDPALRRQKSPKPASDYGFPFHQPFYRAAHNPSQTVCTLTQGMDGTCILCRLPRLPAQRPGSSTTGWGIVLPQLSAIGLEMGKAQPFLPASSQPEEPALAGSGGTKAITGCGSCFPGWWGAQSSGCSTLLEGGLFANPGASGCRGLSDPAGLYFFWMRRMENIGL